MGRFCFVFIFSVVCFRMTVFGQPHENRDSNTTLVKTERQSVTEILTNLNSDVFSVREKANLALYNLFVTDPNFSSNFFDSYSKGNYAENPEIQMRVQMALKAALWDGRMLIREDLLADLAKKKTVQLDDYFFSKTGDTDERKIVVRLAPDFYDQHKNLEGPAGLKLRNLSTEKTSILVPTLVSDDRLKFTYTIPAGNSFKIEGFYWENDRGHIDVPLKRFGNSKEFQFRKP